MTRAPYGDMLCPAYYIEYRGWSYQADRAGDVYHDYESDGFADRWIEARTRFREAAGYRYDGLSHAMICKSEEMLERWARVFHGVRFETISTWPNSGSELLLLDTPNYRAHVGRPDPDPTASWTTGELFESERNEWRAYFDGEVYC